MINRIFRLSNSSINPNYNLYVWTIQNLLVIHQIFRSKLAANRAFKSLEKLYNSQHGLGRIAMHRDGQLIRCFSRIETTETLHLPKLDSRMQSCLQVMGMNPGSEIKRLFYQKEDRKGTFEINYDALSNNSKILKETSTTQDINKLPKSALKHRSISEKESAVFVQPNSFEKYSEITKDAVSLQKKLMRSRISSGDDKDHRDMGSFTQIEAPNNGLSSQFSTSRRISFESSANNLENPNGQPGPKKIEYRTGYLESRNYRFRI